MNFKTERSLSEKVYTTVVKFDSYGGGVDIDADGEKIMIEDFGAPKLDIGAITFSGKYAIAADGSVTPDAVAGESVTFVLSNKEIDIKEGFEARYSVDCKKIGKEQLGTIMNTPELVAEARCLLFETKVKASLVTCLADFRKLKTRFESGASVFTA